MSMTRRGRWASALLAAALAGAVSWPGAASAAGVTVTTSPGEVHQGDAIELSVVVPADRPGTRTTKVELTMPADAPIGEVYPLSVPDWAPTITTRTLDQPVPGIHASELNQVTHAVTWLRVTTGGTGATRLPLGMGPMPATDRLVFTVVQTYADGTVVRWADPAGGAHPAPTVALLPPLPGTATHGGDTGPGGAGSGGAAHGGHGTVGGGQNGAAPDGAAPDGAAPDGGTAGGPTAGATDDGPSADLLLGGGLLAGLAGGAAIGWLFSRRRRGTLTLPSDTADSPTTTAPGPDPDVHVDAPRRRQPPRRRPPPRCQQPPRRRHPPRRRQPPRCRHPPWRRHPSRPE
nr:YcnI family protein [Micromonospora sp. NBS 11-29]